MARAATRRSAHEVAAANVLRDGIYHASIANAKEQVAKELNVKIFTAEIIYHLFDKFTAYMADVRREQQAKAALVAVYPCVAEISSAEHVWVRGGGGDPILVGLLVFLNMARRKRSHHGPYNPQKQVKLKVTLYR